MKRLIPIVLAFASLLACTEEKEHIAPAINARDSVAMMTSYGVNTLISDSGVIKYRIVTERWEINQALQPTRWIFDKGLFMEQFDEKFHTEAYIQCDTAYYYDEKRLWELRSRVRVRTVDGLRFASEELFYNTSTHEVWSNRFSRIVTPEREMQGSYFTGDDRFTHYSISNSKGSFVRGTDGGKSNDSILSAPDTTKAKLRMPTVPTARTKQ